MTFFILGKGPNFQITMSEKGLYKTLVSERVMLDAVLIQGSTGPSDLLNAKHT